ncbi:vinorine synthase [Phtheirospermum japonicum]|uniref:Vinorine synthase n=1 Tax=Phtheirospermum japonicum TaxID=374723 RepID=A0A830BL61_9LAMI|nr:vinorine synthase [Phtheirospermum japonicum]
MEFEIKITSQESIKPSSPTPEPLQKYQLSFLDQIAPPVFMPLVYFYQTHGDKNHLKISLSQALSIFYPLAGRQLDGASFDCNDQGAPFFEAEANCNLSELVKNPDPKNMNKLIPYKLDDVRNLGMAVQITSFRCGGLSIGLLISHKIADALSFFSFANTWAATARGGGGGLPPPPKFESAAIFPPRDVAGFVRSTGTPKDELVCKIFTFPAEKISELRERFFSGGRAPTRVEALSAFIWTRFISVTETKPDPNKIYTVLHTVNLRNRLDPALTEYHFGNICRAAIATPAVGDGGSELMKKVREAIQGVSGDEEGAKHLDFIKERMARFVKGELVPFNFTSLCRFPLYEADFGWGKPVWVGSAGLTYKNLVTFVDTASGDGIEAWVNLRKEDMEKFEADLELQQFLISQA